MTWNWVRATAKHTCHRAAVAKYSPHTNFLGPKVGYPKLGSGSQNLKQQRQVVGQNFAEMIHISEISVSLEEGQKERTKRMI